jgi:hypothetical protein
MEQFVKISIDNYNELRECKRLLEEKITVIEHRVFSDYKIITGDEATSKLAKSLKESLAEIRKLENRLSEIKIMTIREFKKWRSK